MGAYYNENNAFAASWLRELIKANVIAQGDVDERSIEDVLPSDLEGYKQCHFFAGIGVWSYALRQAGWPDDREVWTGSCPCQPFSAAGKGKGVADERHLWPSYFHLIEKRRPRVVFGEQVASKDGLTWLDLVQTDLEGANYSVRAADICAAGFGAPHIRQRLYFVGDSAFNGVGALNRESVKSIRQKVSAGRPSISDEGQCDGGSSPCAARSEQSGSLSERDVANTGVIESRGVSDSGREALAEVGCSSQISGFWSNCDWIPCIDGKERPVEPGTFPLAHGVANRVGLLRGYGNAIVAPQAQAFIEAYLEAENDL